MVVFTCSNCGDSVKKPQVEKHFAQRRCWGSVLCCIDCLKDFPGDEYKSHNACITENERYGGKNYVAKPNVNKGEQKQQKWFEKVLNAIEKAKSQHPPWLQTYFERLKDYPNIPSKKAKFESFLRNSLGVRDNKAITVMWTAIDHNVEKQLPPTNQANGKSDNINTKKLTENDENLKEPVMDEGTAAQHNTCTEKKLSKRERKENRKKEANKKEKKDLVFENVNDDVNNISQKKKKQRSGDKTEKKAGKKRKADELDHSDTGENGEPVNGEKGDEEGSEQSEDEGPAKKRHKTKFDWSGVIVKVLQGKESEIKMKKLRKKVLGEYLSQGCTERSEEKLWAKFDKKLKKNPLVKIQNDRVKLKN